MTDLEHDKATARAMAMKLTNTQRDALVNCDMILVSPDVYDAMLGSTLQVCARAGTRVIESEHLPPCTMVAVNDDNLQPHCECASFDFQQTELNVLNYFTNRLT